MKKIEKMKRKEKEIRKKKKDILKSSSRRVYNKCSLEERKVI